MAGCAGADSGGVDPSPAAHAGRARRARRLQLGAAGTAAVVASAAELALADPLRAPAVLATLGAGGAVLVATERVRYRAGAALARAAQAGAGHARVDPVTGLLTHGAFQERLAREAARAGRARRPLALVVVDVDGFRAYNGRHGHARGDDLLAAVADALRAHARAADTLARLGDDELAWLLPGADGVDAWQAADRMRRAVAAAGTARGEVTVSAGVADLEQAEAAGDLLRLAGGALDWARREGRDSVVRYVPDVVELLSDAERVERVRRAQALNAVRALARAVDAKDSFTRRHSERVARLSVLLADRLGWETARLGALQEAALLHDVGKIGVPDAVLLKPGRLTDDEFAEIRRHPGLGADIVADVLSQEQVDWVRAHHERWDGRGYPDRRVAGDIPDGARIIGLADAWDAMTSNRPYRSALPPEEALRRCTADAGTHFAPEAVAALRVLFDEGLVTDPAEAEAVVYRGTSGLVRLAPLGAHAPAGDEQGRYRGAEGRLRLARRPRQVPAEGLVYRGVRVPAPETAAA